jgi:hypothetical protein
MRQNGILSNVYKRIYRYFRQDCIKLNAVVIRFHQYIEQLGCTLLFSVTQHTHIPIPYMLSPSCVPAGYRYLKLLG